VMKVQTKPWKPSDALDVVPGTPLVGLTLFKSGSDAAITAFPAPIRVTIPVPPPPKGKVAKVVFWDAASGKYSDTGCTVVASAKSTEAVADCNHLTDFGVSYVDAQGAAGVCGDGIVQSIEECDDGNTKNGDGCSSACKKELSTIDKLKQTLVESPNVAIGIGASLGGLILIIVCLVFVKRRYGRVLCCLKGASVHPSVAEEPVKPTPAPSAQPAKQREKYALSPSDRGRSDSKKENTISVQEFSQRMQPTRKPH